MIEVIISNTFNTDDAHNSSLLAADNVHNDNSGLVFYGRNIYHLG